MMTQLSDGMLARAKRKNITPYTVTLTSGSGNWPLPALFNEITVEGWAGGGAGGGDSVGGAGGSTIFGPCTATGGLGGTIGQANSGGTTPAGGLGGSASGGDENLPGLQGKPANTWNYGGDGADAPGDGGTGGIAKVNPNGNQTPGSPSTPGAGGAGKYESVQSTSYVGGGGGSGSKFKRVFPSGFFTSDPPYSVGAGGTKTGRASAGARGEIRITVS